jgi:hypothetical protein
MVVLAIMSASMAMVLRVGDGHVVSDVGVVWWWCW